MKIRIQPYKRWSGGAKALGLRAGILRATRRQVEKHGDFDIIINWGSSAREFGGEYINPPEAVALASNKLETAQRLARNDIPQPDFTTDRATAQQWVDEGDIVVGRHQLRASAGRGIRLYGNAEAGAGLTGRRGQNPGGRPDGEAGEAGALAPDEREPAGLKPRVEQAPLYTRYFKKADEYRVHVYAGRVIDVQQKKKREEIPNEQVDFQVRNAAAGWVFCRGGVECPDLVQNAAIRAVDALGLDFGAVDVGYNRHHGTCAVFEVNTAPGLEGTTLDRYYDALVSTYPQLTRGMYAKRRAA